MGTVLVGALLGSLALIAHADETAVTWVDDVAPIIHGNCAVCHRPGGAGPFSLLEYPQARQRAALIAAVTQIRFMPPWLPTAGRGEFLGERRLTDEQIATLAKWAATGAAAGDLDRAPPAPAFSGDWTLGEPDLIVDLPETYQLRADGDDVYRTFVVEVPVTRARWVRAVEFRPRNAKVVHHAVMQVDRSLASSRRDEADEGPGYEGMDTFPAENPDGQILGWTPGKLPREDQGMAWRLEPGTWMVMQLHLQPTGKPEPVQPRVGLYFTEDAPTRQPFSLLLRNDHIDIPAGESEHVIEESFELPIDVSLLGIYPHAHYLAREMQIYATLPDGQREWLLHIDDWDFNWQDDYRYLGTRDVPAGSTVTMRYTFDNSADNPRNPSDPPVRVKFGTRSADEMANVSLQVLPKDPSDQPVLREAMMRHKLARGYEDWHTLNGIGAALQAQGRGDEAMTFYARASASAPTHPTPRYNLANAHLRRGALREAVAEYGRVLELEPNHNNAWNNLSVALLESGHPGPALKALREQVAIRPRDAKVHHNLAILLLDTGDGEAALAAATEAASLAPDFPTALAGLGDVQQAVGDWPGAGDSYQRALALDPDFGPALVGAAQHATATRQWRRAITLFTRAIRSDDQSALSANSAAWTLATAEQLTTDAATTALSLSRLATNDGQTDDISLLDTLAAAYAATGDFASAVRTAERVARLAPGSPYADYAAEFDARLTLYRSRQRYVSRD